MTTEKILPLHCEARAECLGTQFSLKASKQEINELRTKIEHLEIRLTEHETSLSMRTASADLTRELATRVAMQKIEASQRRTIDNLEETISIMRQIMQTNGINLESVYAIVEDKLDRRVKALAGEEPETGRFEWGRP